MFNNTHTETDIITKLASLSPIEYDRVRIAEAKLLNIRPATLDNLVKTMRAIPAKDNKAPFSVIEPWHEPIDPAAFVDSVLNPLKPREEFIATQKSA